jgi:hypothetical protein
VQTELVAWIADRAWTTGDGPKAIFVGVIERLRTRNALLPGITTLEVWIAEGRAAAEKRLWVQVAALVGPATVSALLRLLDVPDDAKHQFSELERLRKAVFRSSWKGMVKALRRLEDIHGCDRRGTDPAGAGARVQDPGPGVSADGADHAAVFLHRALPPGPDRVVGRAGVPQQQHRSPASD